MNRMWTMLAGSMLVSLTSCGGVSEEKLAGNATNVATVIGGRETSDPDDVSAAAEKTPKLKAGQWETTTEVLSMQMAGAPSGVPPGVLSATKIPKTTASTCLTPKEAANPKGNMLAAQKDRTCDVKTMEWSAGHMNVVMTCVGKDGAGTSNIHMRGTFSETAYAMDGEMGMVGPTGMKMTMKTHTAGKYVGACTS